MTVTVLLERGLKARVTWVAGGATRTVLPKSTKVQVIIPRRQRLGVATLMSGYDDNHDMLGAR